MVRFGIPVATIGADYIFTTFQAGEYAESQRTISATASDIERLAPQSNANANSTGKSLLDRLKDRVAAPVEALNVQYARLKSVAESATERLISLVVIFLLQTLVVPVLMLWLLKAALGFLLRPDIQQAASPSAARLGS